MKNCSRCGSRNDDIALYCTTCGNNGFVAASNSKNGNGKSMFIGILLGSLIATVVALSTVIFFMNRDKSSEAPSSDKSYHQQDDYDEEEIEDEDSEEDANDSAEEAEEEDYAEIVGEEDNYHEDFHGGGHAVAPETEAAVYIRRPSVKSNETIVKDGYYKVVNTQDRAVEIYKSIGNLEEVNGKMTIRDETVGPVIAHVYEGDVVVAVADYSTLDGDFVRVEADGTKGWMIKDYLESYNPYENIDVTSFKKGMTVRVCYDTPSSAGINIRKQATSYSEKLCTIAEGTVIEVAKDYSASDNGYVFIRYDHPHAGTVYEGWVLEQYLEYYGNN